MGKKRASSRDVAERAGVSRTTVSFVLNDVPGVRVRPETRQRILDAARELNYHPDATARRMVSGRTRVIGFVLPQTPDQVFDDRFLPQVLHGLTRAALAQGYHLLLEPVPPSENPAAYLRLVRERHVDGIILGGPRSDDTALIRLHREGVPVAVIGRALDDSIPSVDIDNVGGAEMAVAHLIGLGHRQIGMITNAPPEYTASLERLHGYRRALEKAGLPYRQDMVRFGAFTSESGLTAVAHLLQADPRPSALFVASDTVAIGALRGLREYGLRPPQDVAIVGFDDVPVAQYLEPALTTVRLPAFGLGWAAMELVIRLLEAPEDVKEKSITLDTELIVRASSGPPPSAATLPTTGARS